MLRFQHIEYLWLLMLIPLLAIMLYRVVRKHEKREAEFGDRNLMQKLLSGFKLTKQLPKWVLFSAGIFFTVLALANLQGAMKTAVVQRKGIDVVIALDVSNSMLATDLSPSRLDRTKQFLNRLVDKIDNNRIGLVVFAGRSYLSVPLTIDVSALKMSISNASPDQVPAQGTVLSKAIEMAGSTFQTKEAKYKSIVLLTDGEDHEEDAISITKKMADQGITVHAVGVGSVEGATIPDPATGTNKLDRDGNEVRSKLNEDMLLELATAGKGMYFKLGQPEQTAEMLANEINQSEQRSFGQMAMEDYDSYFQFFLVAAFLLFLLEYFLPQKRRA
jgi:Ca-activated chloride channel family protein